MSEVTHIHPEDLLNMLKRAEQIGAYKTLNWLCWEFTKDMTAKDIVDLVHSGIGSVGEELYSSFKKEHFIYADLRKIIEKRKKQKGVKTE